MGVSFQYYLMGLISSSVIIIILFSHPASSQRDKQTQELIDKICRETEDYGYCNNIFNENIHSQSADVYGLAKITVEQSLSNATNTHSFITQLLENATDPALKNALIVCENGYRIVMQSFQDAFLELYKKDYRGVVDSERGAPRAQGSCVTSFVTPPNPINPLVERNREMRILISMAVVSGYMLNP